MCGLLRAGSILRGRTVSSARKAACLIPTRRFLVPRLDKIADQDPPEALESRQRVLQASAFRGDHILFCHDPAVPTARLQSTPSGIQIASN